MDEATFVCVACGEEKPRNRRLAPGRQQYCSRPSCQRARRNARRRERWATDEAYREANKGYQETWREKNPGYDREYRKDHPQVVERNRLQQRLRDAKRRRGQDSLGDISLVERSRGRGVENPDSVVVSQGISTGNYFMKRIDGSSQSLILAHVVVVGDSQAVGQSGTSFTAGACKEDPVATR